MDRDVIAGLPVAVYSGLAQLKGGRIFVRDLRFLNRCIERLTGFTPEEIESNPRWWEENVHEEDRNRAFFRCEDLREGVGVRTFRFRRKEGGYLLIKDTAGNLDCGEEEEFEVLGVWEVLEEEGECREVFEAIDRAPAVGILIYRDRIVYANRAAADILGYSPEELLSLRPEDVVAEEFKERVRETVARRLKGEQFENLYKELPVVTGEGVRKIISLFSRTVRWKGEPAGFVIFLDVTKRKRYERFFRVLRDVNQLIISAVDERELLDRICELLVREAGFRMVWVGVPDPETHYVVPLNICGYGRDYVSRIRISTDASVPEGRGPTGTALREGRIVINPDTRTNPAVEPWREEMLRRGFLSSCAIPLRRDNRTVAILNIYSGVPHMFTEEELELLEEIQRDLSFALERIEKEKFMKMTNAAIEKGHEWVLITDEEGTILYANHVVEEISGYRREELVGKNPRIFKSGYHSREFYRGLWQTLRAGKTFHALFVNRKKNGEVFYLDQTIVPIPVGREGVRFVGLGKDVTSEKFLREELARLKYLDVVTGLPNREGFLAGVELALQKDRDLSHVLFIIDVVDFTGINQVYGTTVGDRVLREIGTILKEALFKRDIVGRIGGDEFGVLARGVAEKEISSLTGKLLNVLSGAFEVEGRTIRLSVNVGASLYPKDAGGATELIEKAFLALAFAKREGENTCRFFSEEINSMVRGYFRMRDELEEALREDRFLFYFQPFYYADTRSVAGLEALIRLKDKSGRILTPREFIFTLERTGLIRDVEDRMLEKLREFILRHRRRVTVSFNVSPKSFRDERFVEKIREVSKGIGRFLVLEITERLLVENQDYAKNFLEEVRAAGVKVAIDDFGTGYSSLAYLESLPADILKIDMQFVHKIAENPKSLAIVETIIELARRLGMKTTAEGVETEEQLRILNELGINYVQGFLLARPMPEEEISLLLI